MAANLSNGHASGAVRTFLAVDLPESQKASIGRLQNDFAEHHGALKLVSPSLLHITVKFLGRLAPERLDSVMEVASQAALQAKPFELRFTGLGAFPSERSPRVLWVGLAADRGYAELERLFQALEKNLQERGFDPESRAFSPHITIARTRDRISPPERRLLGETFERVKSTHRITSSFAVDELIVMRSDLSPAGPRYTPMLGLPLGREVMPDSD